MLIKQFQEGLEVIHSFLLLFIRKLALKIQKLRKKIINPGGSNQEFLINTRFFYKNTFYKNNQAQIWK